MFFHRCYLIISCVCLLAGCNVTRPTQPTTVAVPSSRASVAGQNQMPAWRSHAGPKPANNFDDRIARQNAAGPRPPMQQAPFSQSADARTIGGDRPTTQFDNVRTVSGVRPATQSGHVRPIGGIRPTTQPSNSQSIGRGRFVSQPANGPPNGRNRLLPQPEEIAPGPPRSLSVSNVIDSIHSTFPLLEAAYQQAEIAAGKQTAAWGAFDTKLKAATESGPLGFYETYRNSAGFSRPIYGGGELFGGYRVGRGDFQPWYLERQTNDGGELKGGFRVPLLRDRTIDARRAELWRANYDQQRAQPEIRAALIMFVRDGSIAYWKWIAAGLQYEIGRQALLLAKQRNDKLKIREKAGDVDPPVLQDAQRAIAQREAKLLNLQRKLRQAGFKLSLYYRTPNGEPIVPEDSLGAEFPQPANVASRQINSDIAEAFRQRPELAVLDALRERTSVDLAEARNNMLPSIDVQLIGSQDVGAPTSKKRDKSPFELEAGVFVEVPAQRRKARGKMQVADAKLAQIAAKLRFTRDKIVAELQSAYAALQAAFDRLERARESKRLAEYMANVERRKFELGQSNLLSVVLREQYAIEAAEAEVQALLEYFSAQADYDAAMARDRPR